MKNSIIRITLVALLVAAPMFLSEIFAQPAAGGPPGPPTSGQPPCWPPPCIPIDGGIGFLVVAGLALGGKKALDMRKESSEVE